jgi:DNA polymerase (family 10)
LDFEGVRLVPMKNSEIAAIFDDIAEMLKLKKDNIFKIRAYQKVARAIEALPLSVEQLVSENRLSEIPGAGEAITKKLTELVTTGQLQYYEKLKAEFPERAQTARR